MNPIIKAFNAYTSINLVYRIIIGLLIGAAVGLLCRIGFGGSAGVAAIFDLFGTLFVGALRAVAPILVFVLIAAAILLRDFKNIAGLKNVLFLYLIATFLASCVGVGAAMLFPVQITLTGLESATTSAPGGLDSVLKNLLFNMVDNPFRAIANANYIGIVVWAVALGVTLKYTSDTTKDVFRDLSEAITKIVQFVIQFAPIGVMGLIATSIYVTGKEGLISYAKVTILLVVAMLFLALIINPLITWFYIRKNPFPIVFTCYKESGVTAFFTRSSAANIPINMNLCKKLNLDEEIYSISIPLGATVNMGGAAVVIAILSLCTAYTVGVEVSFFSALLLCTVATLGACGASGVAGGSLMLIPLACSLFGIDEATAFQVVGIGVMIGVIQDSLETAINSSTDVLFTAIASHRTGSDVEGI